MEDRVRGCRRRGRTVGWSSARRPGLTLTELIVVMGVVGLLVALAKPALSVARMQAREVACADILRGFGESLMMYTNDNADWLPGVNTSGVALRTKQYAAQGDPSVLNNAELPVQAFDWITPLVVYQVPSLPESWAERFHTLLTTWECPQQLAKDVPLYPFDGSGVPEPLWDELQGYEFPATSYLMPVRFQYWGDAWEGTTLALMEGPPIPIRAVGSPEGWEVRSQDYRSRLIDVGPPARKIFVADGTRYTAADGLVDIDVRPFTELFGCFTSSGGWWPGSTEYGVRAGTLNWDGDVIAENSPSSGLNLTYTYRHSCARTIYPNEPAPGYPGSGLTGSAWDNPLCLNTVFYDGHVESLNDRDSRSIEMWYPTGAELVGSPVGMTTEEAGLIIP
jgi:prepilin-type N-terminal cleavage/methylation domain-containing protein